MAVLEIVFFGLIAFVTDDSTGHALILDGVQACVDLEIYPDEDDCECFAHMTDLFVQHYECDSRGRNCRRIGTEENSTRPLESSVLAVKGVGDEETKWPLEGSVLTVKGVDDEETDWQPYSKPKSNANPVWDFPRGKPEGATFEWLASLESASGQGRDLNPKCLEGVGCPLKARFVLPESEARVCHFYHCDDNPKDGSCYGNSPEFFDEGAQQFMYGYMFESPRPDHVGRLRQALADAVLVEAPIDEGNVITIVNSKENDIPPIPVDPGCLEKEDTLCKIVLVVVNHPVDKCDDRHHFELFYALAADHLVYRDRAIPESFGKRIAINSPSSFFECEPYLIGLEGAPRAFPHDPQECVAAEYP